jgi:molybdenum cofactor biosynthesis enzyme MoaA
MGNTDVKLQRIVMEVFGGCNYKCKMCPQAAPGRERSFIKTMPLDLFEKIIDQIVPKYGTPAINLEGSGEPTLVKNLAEYVRAVKARKLTCLMFCNGFNLSGSYMQNIIDSGIDVIRVSMIGYNREKYLEWMGVDHFDQVYANLIETRNYIRTSGSKCQLMTYHLITDNGDSVNEVHQYCQNIIGHPGCNPISGKCITGVVTTTIPIRELCNKSALVADHSHRSLPSGLVVTKADMAR